MSIELYNRHGKRVSRTRGLDALESITRCFPPGFVADGEWVRSHDRLYLFDLVYAPADWLDAMGVTGKPVASPSCFFPPAPSCASLEALSFPPDDWVMEKKMNGDRVLILSQGPSGLHLQTTPYDQRRKALNALIALLSSSKIAQVQVAMSDFPQTYNLWKDEAEVEGVVFKERSSGYPHGAHLSPEVSFWRKRRFSWDK